MGQLDRLFRYRITIFATALAFLLVATTVKGIAEPKSHEYPVVNSVQIESIHAQAQNIPSAPTSSIDLIVHDIWSTTLPYEVGHIENVKVRIKNVGINDAIETFNTQLLLDGIEVKKWSVSGLAAGDAIEIFTEIWTVTSGDHTLDVAVDYQDDIDENDESNNSRSETWFWHPSQVDLIVQDLLCSTEPLFAGEKEKFSFLVINQGSSTAPAGARYRVWINGDLVVRGDTIELGPGAAYSVKFFAQIPLGGLIPIEVIVNHDGRVFESNFDNNSLRKEFQWPPYLYMPTIMH